MKAKASRVFGDVVFNEADSSLCYSPSPNPRLLKLKGQNKAVGSPQSPEPTILFEESHEERESSGSVLDKENIVNTPHDDKVSTEKKNSNSRQSIRSAELNRLRSTAKSPQRRDLLKKTQAAIEDATTSVTTSLHTKTMKNNTSSSVNQSLNEARKAKEAALQDRAKKTKTVRFQWQEETAGAKSFYERVEENRRQILAVQRKLASAHFEERKKQDEEKKKHHTIKLEQEYKFNSDVYREHQQSLKAEKDKNRKKSIEVRAKIRQNHREGKEKLKAQKQQEDQAIYDIRYDMHKTRSAAAKSGAEDRRKSFQFRAGDAKRIRDIRSQWRKEELKDTHESFELKRAADKDAEEYKRKLEKERRESLNGRNAEARARRIREKEQASLAMKAEHESYELKWAGERDAEAYRRQMNEERRKSLAGRNKESARHAEVMKELRNLAKEKEAESFMLKWAGENDAKAYEKGLEEARRKSLQFRGKESKRWREYDANEHAKAVEEGIAEGKLQSQCHHDVDKYKRECAERRRKSLQYRGKESKLRRLEDKNKQQVKQEQDHKGFELDSLAHQDVQEYIKDCKQKRRKSLALRAKEKRRHAQWKKKQEEKEVQERSKTAYFHSLDAQQMALAKQQERAQRAIDALRSAGCNIKGNPFGDLLDS